ncbi:MAG: hypothetical protein IGS49_18215 [Chlorogloeopsis fritschii C42_A2020_084]|uniref:hypothetical protein n=1 Tax=Chlorogloeopsis fritschii TaxID=1124 RepID=UPI0019DC7CB7|nr:hypothetical protein [Chlorogloeopsis fritschii]MBF2007338.1 hypothetical protein [Chlorogloeopsis fritschii C42_A2020_084]
MRTVNNSVYTHNKSTTAQAYSPSVPLSVYRELAAELQAAQAKMDALTARNHHLVQENQLLRAEIAKTVQSVLHLQNLLDTPTQTQSHYHQVSRSAPDIKSDPKRQANVKHPRQQAPRPRPSVAYTEMEIPDYMSAPIFVEGQEVVAYPFSQPEPGEINNWLLWIAIALIIFLGFGAGYLVVRPFFANQTR